MTFFCSSGEFLAFQICTNEYGEIHSTRVLILSRAQHILLRQSLRRAQQSMQINLRSALELVAVCGRLELKIQLTRGKPQTRERILPVKCQQRRDWERDKNTLSQLWQRSTKKLGPSHSSVLFCGETGSREHVYVFESMQGTFLFPFLVSSLYHCSIVLRKMPRRLMSRSGEPAAAFRSLLLAKNWNCQGKNFISCLRSYMGANYENAEYASEGEMRRRSFPRATVLQHQRVFCYLQLYSMAERSRHIMQMTVIVPAGLDSAWSIVLIHYIHFATMWMWLNFSGCVTQLLK